MKLDFFGRLFELWLRQWDTTLRSAKRKVLLYLDNFSGHPNIKLDQITLKFFPPNTTAASQPCDQGIIQNVKVIYRHFLLRHRIASIEKNEEYKVNLLQALHFLRRSWDAVKSETIARCFTKAGFVIDSPVLVVQRPTASQIDPAIEEEETEEMETIWTDLKKTGEAEGELADYLTIDEDLVTGSALSLDDIVRACSRGEVEEELSDSETDSAPEKNEMHIVNAREAKKGLEQVRRYLDRCVNTDMQKICDKLEDFLSDAERNELKQKDIRDCFRVLK